MVTLIKVPRTIRIGGHQYTIVFSQGVSDAGDYGRVNHRTLTIELAPERPMSQKAASLIHEILHIINNVYNNRHCEEDDLDALAEGFNQVLEALGIELDWGDISSA